MIERLRCLFGSGNSEYKQVIAVRSDLKMGKGKMAAQVAHAAVASALKSKSRAKWLAEGQRKVVVKVSGEKELEKLMVQARDMGVPTALIEDAGHTQLEPGTRTCVGIGPDTQERIDKVTSHLKLM